MYILPSRIWGKGYFIRMQSLLRFRSKAYSDYTCELICSLIRDCFTWTFTVIIPLSRTSNSNTDVALSHFPIKLSLEVKKAESVPFSINQIEYKFTYDKSRVVHPRLCVFASNHAFISACATRLRLPSTIVNVLYSQYLQDAKYDKLQVGPLVRSSNPLEFKIIQY